MHSLLINACHTITSSAPKCDARALSWVHNAQFFSKSPGTFHSKLEFSDPCFFASPTTKNWWPPEDNREWPARFFAFWIVRSSKPHGKPNRSKRDGGFIVGSLVLAGRRMWKYRSFGEGTRSTFLILLHILLWLFAAFYATHQRSLATKFPYMKKLYWNTSYGA